MSSLEQNARKLIDFLDKKSGQLTPLLILTHDYPDPDALSSAFALQYLAEARYGIKSKIAYGGIIGRMENREMVHTLKIPARKLHTSDLQSFGHIALVDTQPAFRNNAFPAERKATLVVDQHASEKEPVASCAIIDPSCGATCVLLARALLLAGIDLPARLATALAYGIITDTQHFFRANQPEVIQTYLDIIPFCDMKALATIQNPSRSKRFFRTLARGIDQAMACRRLIVSHLGVVDDPDLVSQIADLLLTSQGARWALCTGRFKGSLRVSLRLAQKGVLASEILRDIFEDRGQAGGHDTIAGGSFRVGTAVSERAWRRAETALIERLARRLGISGDFYYPFR